MINPDSMGTPLVSPIEGEGWIRKSSSIFLFLLGFRGCLWFALGLLGFLDVLSAFTAHELRPPV
jgi:hypothetical protein